jgi:hypothetical protein
MWNVPALSVTGFVRVFVIFQWNPQHAKAFPFFLFHVFVVNLMGFSNRSKIPIVDVIKPSKSAVDQYFMYQEIGNAIEQDTQADVQLEIISIHHSKHDE